MNTSTSINSATSLPQDILYEIFTRLSVKSIVRFRCVSKFCYSLVNNSFFADVHRNRSLTCPGTSILLRLPSKTCQQVFYIVNLTEENHGKLQAHRVRYMDQQCFHNRVHLRCTKGLICLANDDGDAAVCNPIIRQHVSLPRTRPVRPSTSQNFASAVLGFDSVSERYKVFMSELRCIHGRGDKKHWVLTLGEDESWREIIVPNYPETSLHIDGVIYLINWTVKREIIAFNVGAEEFRTLPFPRELRHRTSSVLRSPWIEVAGRLAAVTVDHQWSRVEVWALEKSMEWEKYMIPIPLEDRETIRKACSMDFTGKCNGEIVMLIHVGETFLIFVTAFGTPQVWRKFEICGIHDRFICLDRVQNAIHIIEENVFFPSSKTLNFQSNILTRRII
ncbi:PREDICTED: F-box only protein 8-like isoform X2 [Ipomoea nil]|uniref:F-box only protein 8-like isoform X2 n=1 Tax=Ipomoea nil TaxID=35883 RepID=UPI0009017F0A|nr:PREDICTED: F-box only protein 8-like isoform X2 [Ipomoea nil]